MKKAILFGANGYLGRHIAHFLKQQQIEFVPTDIANNSIDGYENYVQADVTITEELNKLNFNVDYVLVFSGLTGTNSNPEVIKKYSEVNVDGLSNIINVCKSKTDLRIIFPSTRLVYKGIENTPLKEEAEKEAKTIYAENKRTCEKLLTNSGVAYTIFRICVPYGNLFDKTYSYGTIGFFMGKALAKENISLYGDGSFKRTFTHVEDICLAIIKGMQLKVTKDNIYNIGGNDDLSLLDVANLVASKYGVSVDFVDWPPEALKIESGDTIFDDHKLSSVLNYNYQHKLKDWLAEID